jgi:hypothetical protein
LLDLLVQSRGKTCHFLFPAETECVWTVDLCGLRRIGVAGSLSNTGLAVPVLSVGVVRLCVIGKLFAAGAVAACEQNSKLRRFGGLRGWR